MIVAASLGKRALAIPTNLRAAGLHGTSVKGAGPETHHRPPMALKTAKWRRSRLCVTIPNVLTREECADFIDKGETDGFHRASINYGNGIIVQDEKKRNSERCFIRDEAAARKIWARIKDFVPSRKFGRDVLGLDPDFRLLKYTKGNFFHRHKDGPTKFDDGSRSYLTVVLFLNQGFKGGHTELFDDSGQVPFHVRPVCGSALIHDHDIEHAAMEMESGIRYVMRTVVMFKPRF